MKKEYIIYKLSDASKEACKIDNELFPMYNVKRGLRNEDGTGVLVGLTKVGNVVGYERLPEGGLKAIPGKLFYRGYDVEDIAHGLIKEKRFGFEEVAYLLLSGKLPDIEELAGTDLRQYAARTEAEDEHPGSGGTEHHEHPGP